MQFLELGIQEILNNNIINKNLLKKPKYKCDEMIGTA